VVSNRKKLRNRDVPELFYRGTKAPGVPLPRRIADEGKRMGAGRPGDSYTEAFPEKRRREPGPGGVLKTAVAFTFSFLFP
jgi:hypothetical protein